MPTIQPQFRASILLFFFFFSNSIPIMLWIFSILKAKHPFLLDYKYKQCTCTAYV